MIGILGKILTRNDEDEMTRGACELTKTIRLTLEHCSVNSFEKE